MANLLKSVLICLISLCVVVYAGKIMWLNFLQSMVYTLCNFYIARRFRVLFVAQFDNTFRESKVLLTARKESDKYVKIEFIMLCVTIILAVLCFIFYINDAITANLQLFLFTFFVWNLIFYLKKLNTHEITYITSVNNLTLGYGAAIWYYKNYLDRFLPENFWERVREYESRHQIALPRKLYILCPKSCRVKQYIDNIDGIEWCRELTSLLVNVGGVVERRYNISIYRMEYKENVLHCAIEYAQPLKNLLTLKENGRITVEEMNTQRDLFCKNLNKMLRDSKDSYQACELIEFNDEINEPNEVLFDINSIQQFLRNRVP